MLYFDKFDWRENKKGKKVDNKPQECKSKVIPEAKNSTWWANPFDFVHPLWRVTITNIKRWAWNGVQQTKNTRTTAAEMNKAAKFKFTKTVLQDIINSSAQGKKYPVIKVCVFTSQIFLHQVIKKWSLISVCVYQINTWFLKKINNLEIPFHNFELKLNLRWSFNLEMDFYVTQMFFKFILKVFFPICINFEKQALWIKLFSEGNKKRKVVIFC